MLILLPPSEGKIASVEGEPVSLTELVLPKLPRRKILDALVKLSKGNKNTAIEALSLSPGQRDEVVQNTELKKTGALPAGTVYTGVLYEALDLETLPEDAREYAERSVLVFSGLWGVVRLTDRIPPYRCSMSARLPGVGGLAAYWRKVLPLKFSDDKLVLDLRSTPYAAAWKSPDAVAVRVLHGGKVVSHFNKATKGRLVRDLAIAGADPQTQNELVTVLRDLKYTVDDAMPGRIDVLVDEL